MSTHRLSPFSSQSNRRGKRRRGAGLARVALVSFVLLMLVLPLAGGRASAADDELIILDDTIELAPVDDAIVDDAIVDETETPSAELPPLDDTVDDPVIDDPVLDPGLDDPTGDPIAGPSDLTLNPVLCPADLDLWSLDYYGLAAACQGGYANGWEFSVSDVGGTPFGQQVVADSYVPVSGLPANDYLVTVSDPAAGPVTMRVMCAADDLLGNDAIGPFEAGVASQTAALTVQGDLQYRCDVFIVDIGDSTGGDATGQVSFAINKHVCPENIVSDDPYFLASVCHEQAADVDFTFDDGAGTAATVTTDVDGLAGYGPVHTGAWTVTETIPGGYGDPQVFCGFDDALGNDVGGYEHPDMTAGAFAIDVPADAAYAFCDVHNHPLDSEGGSITVFKYGCPDAFDPATMDAYAECGALTDGVQFNASGPSGYASQSSTGDALFGAVFFGGLEAGQYDVVETVPDGFSALVVTCSSDTKQFVVQHEEDLTDAPSLTWDLDDDEDIVCFWYNVPTHAEDVDVFITKYACPVGFSSADPADFAGQCTDSPEGVDFAIEHSSGATATDDTGGQPARAAFTPWHSGDSTITEDVPAGYGEPIVYCYVTDDFGTEVPGYEYAPYQATDGAVDVTIPAVPADDLYTLYCDWFNMPTHDDGTVTIHKWACPAGTAAGLSKDDYLDTCTQPMEGVDFEQGAHSGSKQTVTTDVSGEVSFPVDEDSDWSIEEVIPSGYDENPMAFCRWGGYQTDEDDETLVYAVDGFSNLGPNGGTTLRFDTYESFGMSCDWFNIPADDHSDITVYKYTCPAGYDLHAYDADPKMDCDDLTNGVRFNVDGPDGYASQSDTGDAINGAVRFGGVEPGAYVIRETLPTGTIATWVTCQWSESTGPYVYEELEPYAPADGVGTHIAVELAEGDDLVCQWYNVPEQTWHGGELTITKYWCEGYVVSADGCELGSGVRFVVQSTSGGSPILVETGADGAVTLSLPAGGWTVAEKDYEWCKAVASNVAADGTILTESGHETTMTVYNCNADLGHKNPPVKQFPNTGAGTMAAAPAAPAGQGLATEILTALGGLLQLGLIAAKRAGGLAALAALRG